jgi:hypothetical protein
MLGGRSVQGCCDRCPLPEDRILYDHLSRVAGQAAVARRRLLKAAVFPPRRSERGSDPGGDQDGGGPPDITSNLYGQPEENPATHSMVGFPDTGQLPRATFGVIRDVSPQVLVLGDSDNEQRFTLTPDAAAWRGAQMEPASLQPGDNAVIRLHPASRHIVDRIWASIGRVTGIIAERSGNTLLVSEGATRQAVVVIHPRALGRIQVRFPALEPGYLVDIIGLRHDGELEGLIPATSQPAYPASRLPAPILASGRVAGALRGSATWHESRDEPTGVLGLSYPALDPDTGCAEDAITGYAYGYARMPYLSLGSVLRVRNECTDTACTLPVTACAPIARLFNDRCVTCGTSPRGRIADLTMASFVALGGDLDRGCFNATITIGE